jgi:hypothetical protein
MKAEKAAKKEVEEEKRRQYIERVARNKIKNDLKTCKVIARRRERERKKAVEALKRAKEFVPIGMLEAIPNPKQTTTDANIELQLQEALVSTIAANNIDPALDLMDIVDSSLKSEATYIALADNIASQANFIGFDMEWDHLDADDDADTGLF